MVGLYGKGMHDFVLREFEIGKRAATVEDEELNGGYGVPPAILDIQYREYCEAHPEPESTEPILLDLR